MSPAAEKNFQEFPAASGSGRGLRFVYHGAAVADARGPRGTSLLVEFGSGPLPCVLAVGRADEVARHPGAPGATVVALPDSIILPGFVNAHTHLDLTHIGPKPHDASHGFVPWIDMIRAERLLEPQGVASAVMRGAELCLAGGTVAVGDIAGALPEDRAFPAWRALRESGMLGVSYQELLGIGNRMGAGQRRLASLAEQIAGALDNAGGARLLLPALGLQPHAPYTVDVRVYAEAAAVAARCGLPIATHLAETTEEREFVERGVGPMRGLLVAAGIWEDSILERLGQGLHPVRHLAPALSQAPFTLAHVNDLTDECLELLAGMPASVVYCPRASAYFGAEQRLGPHRYREMIDAGINVALGTDSIVNLPEAAADAKRGGISILDEMRLLYRRDGVDPWLLLALATVGGARALSLPERWFQMDAGGELAGAVAVPLGLRREPGGITWNDSARTTLEAVLRSDAPPVLLFWSNGCRSMGFSTSAGSASSKINHSS